MSVFEREPSLETLIFEFLVLKLVYPPIFSVIRSFLVFSQILSVCMSVCMSVFERKPSLETLIFKFLTLELVYPPIFSLIRSFLVFSHLVCLYVCLSVCPFLRNDVTVTILQADWVPTILGQSPTIDTRCEVYLIWSFSLRVLVAAQKCCPKLVYIDNLPPTQVLSNGKNLWIQNRDSWSMMHLPSRQ